MNTKLCVSPWLPGNVSLALWITSPRIWSTRCSMIEKKELQAKFINPHLCKIQEDFVFTNPYMESEENRWNPLLDQDVQDVRGMPALKEAYMTHAEALIHSDLHTGSIMVNQHDTRVFDPEFSFYGPMAFDVAALPLCAHSGEG